jgi:hypothetical protein
MLRKLHPELPMTIVGRDPTKAAALAHEVGTATPTLANLERADLGLPVDAEYGAVVTALRDYSLNTMRYA